MTQLLLRLFLKNRSDWDSPAVRARVGTLSGAVGIGCNLLLCLMKLFIGIASGSVSVTADAMNNLSDASGSIVTLLGFRVAGKPADEHHPYGHARAEYLSGLAVAVLVLFIGLELAKSSVSKILNPAALTVSGLSAAVLVGSIAVKFWLFRFNKSLGEKIGSSALLATASDSRNDCIATGAVLLSAILERWPGIRCDGVFGLGVALFILHSGWRLAKDTVSPLLGENADPELREKLEAFIRRQPGVLGYHDLMVHDYGPGQRYASLHVEMDHREDPLDCHDRIDLMERQCLKEHNVHLVIHYDPVITDDPELQRLQEKTARLLAAQDNRLSLHDFRMIPGRRHMNLVFDVPLPSDLRERKEKIRQSLEDALNEENPMAYHVRITYDAAEYHG